MIVDASVAFKWLVEEEDSGTARSWLAREALRAPRLILAEIGNALWKRQMRGDLSDADGAARQLARLPDLITVEPDVRYAAPALLLAVELKHAIYDCVYLAMAITLDAPLLTADARFVAKLRTTRYVERLVAL